MSLKLKDKVKWSVNGNYLFGTVANLFEKDLTVGSEKIVASEKEPIAQIELPSGQTAHVSVAACTVVEAKDFDQAVVDFISDVLQRTQAGFEWGCEAYKNEASTSKETIAKLTKDHQDMCESKSKIEKEFAEYKTAREAEVAKMKEDYEKAKSTLAELQLDTQAKERISALKEISAVSYLGETEAAVLDQVKTMSQGEFDRILKVAKAAQTSLPKLTDQSQTALPKLTDQTQTSLPKLTQAEVQSGLDSATKDNDPALNTNEVVASKVTAATEFARNVFGKNKKVK